MTLKKYGELEPEVQRNVTTDWEPPNIPEIFTSAIVTLMSSGNVTLDFTSARTQEGDMLRYSNACGKPQCMWPWVSGYSPTKEDWKSIGFEVVIGRDSAYLTDQMYHFESWIGKSSTKNQ
ncbi:hypothetical protein TUMSATVNIG1_60380 (plasmid) [Vibrio nigripulchritudo]|uniref:Uncharacterized protein n=1 Tax=Vibrio nigripulchritudo SOn1 TaxID=1238450 RepID=A0AAV2VHY9_9VIBR|nr:hypothetical protein [Vibrio nigripulchritudo]BCL74052.1 hypothetical protein VNTUMSATTG_59890 [Vibrio nigripulchritudo]BDU35429.1 hypothetical protein TUMSATVNIG1_60380 [Vibrio nigripulchritudo]CCO44287.1 hypothetical protein VIBNISOn1_1080004 [Vibrio nigripulchritudo SOn1]